jgi:hypothetical protein
MKEFSYNYETLANLSGFTPENLRKAISRGELKVGDLRSAAIWLAACGTLELRAAMAQRLIPAVLGTSPRADQPGLHNIAASYDIMLQIFKRDGQARALRANRAAKTAKTRRRSRA